METSHTLTHAVCIHDSNSTFIVRQLLQKHKHITQANESQVTVNATVK